MGAFEDMLRGGVEPPALSLTRVDPERRLGVPAGRFTGPGLALPLLAAIGLSVLVYACLRLAPETPIAASLTQRGWIPYSIVFCAAWALAILVIKTRKISGQMHALRISVLPEDDPGFVLTPETAERVLERLFRIVDDPQGFFLTRRIHNALSNLRNMRRIGDVDDVLRTHADNDEAQVDASYTLVRGILWMLPVLGFIGTVIGLSVALGSFGAVLANASDIGELRTALQSVTGGLATAFETTLQGLVATVAVHLLMIFVRGREETFLEDCKDYCQRFVVGRLRLVDADRG
ncbi:MAG: MotA/TolQ/ExbB proton channel family protein [Planctomycetota bacterium]|nr:MotA/TolQ/ExbB proton channel family protein [Planctomycetota bacterium]